MTKHCPSILILSLAIAAGCRAQGLAQIGPDGEHRAHGNRPQPLHRITGANPYRDVPDCGPNSFFGSGFTDAEVEPMIAISPGRPQDIVVTWFQDASISYLTAASRDGGRHWTTHAVPGMTPCDGGDAIGAADPWLSIGPDGTVYLAGFSAYLDLWPAPLPTRNVVHVHRGHFDQAGMIDWSEPSVVQAGPGVFHDRPVVSAHPSEPHRVFVVWNDGTQVPPLVVQPLMFSSSADGGASWSSATPVHIPPGGISHDGEVHVLPNGDLLAIFTVIRTQPVTHQLLAKRSTDGGLSWSPVPTTIAEMPAGAAQPGNSDCRFVGAPIRDAEHGPVCVVMPEYVISAQVASDGSIYVAWPHWLDEDSAEIRVARSTDGGDTWSEPVSVSPVVSKKGIPALAVTADGVVGVSWYDFRADVAGDAPFSAEVWFAQSLDQGQSWRERPLTGPFDMRSAPIRQLGTVGYFIGDYHGIDAMAEGFGAVLSLPAPYAQVGATDLFFAPIAVDRSVGH